ncbi:Hypothetical protein IALB_3026 [Ignavibacterium album JCM 16511]|uniref:DUF3108 domain-containing protein n=1 Tax=Ignavibacterium album (strain DSM 19864 / JCM 16511 / NBRC 101810 / Mat9-16) TaxID=945713 RepID=I0AP22_IGNAJ|nr:hypothetical protein [Ignavibacterium album]AFH50729.1 Hypothetical protein IALB_3026 [Ignavibacterium album JCM 16511]
MKKQTLLYTVLLFALILLQNNSVLQTDNSEITTIKNIISKVDYFPLDNNKELFYDSNFGELKLSIEKKGEIYTTEMISDDFVYRQKLLLKEDGVYIKETYQKIKILLFVNKESKYFYNEPLPRFKYPIIPGQFWEWRGKEFNNDEINTLEIKSASIGFETIKVKAGEFNTMKVITEIESGSGTKNKVTEWLSKDIGIIKSEVEIQGGGLMSFVRDVLGYGTLTFELSEIKNK